MTLDQAIAKAERALMEFSDTHRNKLRAEFDYATAEELAAILRLHDDTVAAGLKRARETVIGWWHSGTGGVH